MHVGTSFSTTFNTSSFTVGTSFATDFNILQAGTSFSTNVYSELEVGTSFSTQVLSAVHNHIFNTLAQDPTTWSSPTPFQSSPGTDSYTSTLGQTSFTLTNSPTYAITQVTLNGVPTSNWSLLAPNHLVLGSAATTGTTVAVSYNYLNGIGPGPGADDPTIPPEVVLKSFKVITGTLQTPIDIGGGELQYNPNIQSTSSVELAHYVKTFSMDMVLGGKWSFNATFEEHDYHNRDNDGKVSDVNSLTQLLAHFPSRLNPFYYGKDDYSGAIVHHRFDISRQIIITISVGKAGIWTDYISPPFAPGAPDFDGYTLTWSGEDLSVIFEQEYQTFPDINVKTTPAPMAWDTIIEMGKLYNFTNFRFEFPDYRIRELRRTKDKPINAMDKIARPYQALRTWEHGLLNFKVIQDPKTRPINWIIHDYMIEETGFNFKFNDDWKNQFTLARVKDQSGVYGETQCTGGHCIGRTLDLKLNEPIDNVDLKTEVIGPAYLHTYTWFYKGAVVTSTDAPTYRGGLKVDEVKATFEPTWNQVTAGFTGPFITNTVPYSADYGYSVFAYGGQNDGFGLDSTYTFKKTDTTGSVGPHGIRPDYTNIEDVIIPNHVVAEAYIDAVMIYNLRRIWSLEFSTRFINNLALPGQVLGVVDFLTLDEITKFTIEKINLAMDEFGEWTQKFSCTRGKLS